MCVGFVVELGGEIVNLCLQVELLLVALLALHAVDTALELLDGKVLSHNTHTRRMSMDPISPQTARTVES